MAVDFQQTNQSGTAVDVGTLKRAFIWKPTSSGKLTRLDLEVYFYSDSTGDVIAELWSVSSHLPSSKIADLGTIKRTQQYNQQAYNFRTLAIPNPPSITAGTEYAVVYYTNGNHIAQHYVNHQTVSTTVYECTYNGSAWNPVGGGPQYKIYIGGVANDSNNNGAGVSLGTGQYMAVQFIPTSSGTLTDVEANAYDLGTSASLHFEIWSDNGSDLPGSMLSDYGTVAINTAAYDPRKVTPASPISVTSGTKYWMVVYATASTAIAEIYGGSTTRSRGVFSTNKTTWYPTLPPFTTYIDPSSAISLVGDVSAAASSGNATTSAIDTTGATLLVVASHYYFGNSTTPTISDSKGNTWTPLTAYANGNYKVCLFYAVNPTVGTGHTFTSNQDTFHNISVAAFSGVDTIAPFDSATGNNANASTIQPGSVTPTYAGSLVISAVTNSAGQIATVSSDMVTLEALNSTVCSAIAYQIQTTATAENPTWSSNAGAAQSAAAIAVFRPTFSQHKEGDFGSTTTSGRSVTFSSNVVSGDLIAVCVNYDNGSGQTISVSDNLGNTYSKAASAVSPDRSTTQVEIWYAKNITGGSCTVTVTPSATTGRVLISAMEFTGINTTSPLDQTATGSNSAGTASQPLTTSSATTTSANEVLIGCAATNGVTDVFTAGSGYSIVGDMNNNGRLGSQMRIVSATGSYSSSIADNNVAYFGAALATFKIGSSGGGGTTYTNTLPDASHPNDCKVTLSQSLSNSLGAANAVTHGPVTLSQSLTSTAVFPRSLTTGPVTLGFSQTAGLLFANSISYSVTLGFSQTVSKRIDQSLSFSATLSQALASALSSQNALGYSLTLNYAATALATFARVLTLGPVTLGYSTVIGTFDQLSFNVTLAQSLSTTKQTSAAISYALTLSHSLSSTALLANSVQFALTLAQQLASIKTTAAAISFATSLGYVVTGIVPNTSENVMTSAFFGFVSMMTATLSNYTAMSATNVESDNVLEADDLKGEVQ